jgi:hypothetical protein
MKSLEKLKELKQERRARQVELNNLIYGILFRKELKEEIARLDFLIGIYENFIENEICKKFNMELEEVKKQLGIE